MINKGYVIWITGLSASGKTTLGTVVTEILRKNNYPVVMLDGDELREALGVTSLHSQEDRQRIALQYAKLVKIISSQGIIVVIATVALFHDVHKWNRSNILGYFEVYLDVPLSELKNRDPKGLYKSFYSGNTHNVAGLDLHVDYPKKPDLHLKYSEDNTEQHDAITLLKEFSIISNLDCLSYNY
jgi:cytidine diphosphoramidate kinase